jgi:hypothetical protein
MPHLTMVALYFNLTSSRVPRVDSSQMISTALDQMVSATIQISSKLDSLSCNEDDETCNNISKIDVGPYSCNGPVF